MFAWFRHCSALCLTSFDCSNKLPWYTRLRPKCHKLVRTTKPNTPSTTQRLITGGNKTVTKYHWKDSSGENVENIKALQSRKHLTGTYRVICCLIIRTITPQNQRIKTTCRVLMLKFLYSQTRQPPCVAKNTWWASRAGSLGHTCNQISNAAPVLTIQKHKPQRKRAKIILSQA